MQVAFTSEKLLAHVPTGTGKSIAGLCSFLGDILPREKLVITTRTKSQAEIFLRESRNINRKTDRGFLAVQMRAKQDVCPLYSREDAGYEEFLQLCRLNQECGYRELFQERVEDIIFLAEDLVKGKGREKVLEYGCPYLVNFELARLARVVVASYQYILNPFLRDLFLSKLGIDHQELLLIVDEAHNLHNMDMLSRSLSKRTLELAQKEADFDLSPFWEVFMAREGRVDFQNSITRQDVEEAYQKGTEVLQERLKRGKKVSYSYRLASFFHFAFKLLGNENWIFFRQGDSLHLKPVLPSEVFSPLKESRKLMLMSGTLEPLELYKKLLGLEEAETYSLPNIFRNSIRYLALRRGMNSSLDSRKALGGELWDSYAQEIARIASLSRGTTLAFFPSYEIMKAVGSRLEAVEEPRDSREAEELKQRVVSRGESLVLGVAGGKFSEGVEFTSVERSEGRRSLIGTIVIAGLPFPRPDLETELKKEVYERKLGRGKSFLFLSVLPMINKVMQASGRAVRSSEDRAAVVFLDDRLKFLRYLPEDTRESIEVVEREEIAEEVRRFVG